jgi:signal transduction histidine kinase
LSRRVLIGERIPLTVLLRSAAPGTMTALMIQPHVVETWGQRAAEGAGAITLLSDTGEVIAGPPVDSTTVRRTAAESGLPWTMAFRVDLAQPVEELSGRRQLLMAGLAAIVLLLAGSGAVLWRVVQQQLAVARLRTNFVAAVSHEFRTPLASLRHVTELLTEDDLRQEQRRSFYQVLERNTDRLQRLVESLLDFSRMEEGLRPYDFTAIRAGGLTRQVVAEFIREGRIADADIDVTIEAAADVPIQVDPAAVSQALWNLLDNAVKYSRAQPRIQVSVVQHAGGVAIRVSDQGLGIPPAEQRQIFGKFVRGEQARRLGIKGTGLGLAIVSHIVKAHGGTIELESREGVGTAFILVFPAGATAL